MLAKATLEPPTVTATADALGRLNNNVSLKGAHANAPDHGPPLIRREGGTTIILPVQDPTARLAKLHPAPCQCVVTSSVTKSSFVLAKHRQIIDLACTFRTLLKISTKLVDNLVEKIGLADSNQGHLAIFKGLHKI